MTWHKIIASPKKYATETNYSEYDASMQIHFSVRSSHPPTQLVLSSADTALDTGNCTTLGQTLSHRKEGLQWGPWPEGIKATPLILVCNKSKGQSSPRTLPSESLLDPIRCSHIANKLLLLLKPVFLTSKGLLSKPRTCNSPSQILFSGKPP